MAASKPHAGPFPSYWGEQANDVLYWSAVRRGVPPPFDTDSGYQTGQTADEQIRSPAWTDTHGVQTRRTPRRRGSPATDKCRTAVWCIRMRPDTGGQILWW